MTDDDIRAVFAELNRIGVDLAKPPGLAIGTGFADGELLPWLRALPDNLGHDEFATRLTAHVNAAQPNVDLPTRADGKPYRGWPTVEQLHAVADMLAREWDPLGARLGELTREDVLDFAYQAVQAAFWEQSPDALQFQIAKFLRQVEQVELGVRPSPVEQRRYLARRIIQTIVDHPGEAQERNVWDDLPAEPARQTRPAGGRSVSFASAKPRSQVVGLGPRPSDPAPLDANAACSECGTIGTVAVVARDLDPRITRFCATCWAKARKGYWVSWRNITPPPADRDSPEGQIAMLEWMNKWMTEVPTHDARFVASALWEDQLPWLEAAVAGYESLEPEEKKRHFRKLAGDLAKQAPNMYGPMPRAIEVFVEKYR